MPREVVKQLPRGVTTLHLYSDTALVSIPFPERLDDATASLVTKLPDPTSVSYRAWTGALAPLTTADTVGLAAQFRLLGLIGPIDSAWTDALTTTRIEIVDMAPPFGLLVRATGRQLAKASAITTTEGYPIVVGIADVPVEARLDPGLAELANGKKLPREVPGLLVASDGRGVVRVFAFRAEDDAVVLEEASGKAERALPEQAYGHRNAFLVTGPEIMGILNSVARAGYVEAVHGRELHNNLAAKDYILNIEPVWTDLGFDGTGVTVDHNDGGVNLTHPDFPAGVILATYGAMASTNNEHGTHTAGSVVGRGLAASSPTNTSGCGDTTTPLSTVRGMAPGATLVTNNLFDAGYTSETSMMQWGYAQGSELSTNSWGYVSDYNYDSYAVSVDTLVRDASSASGNQQFMILFSAGNDGPGASTVGSPGTAKNALTVGASQNDRCGSYVPGQQAGPNINTITTFSGRGPSQGRVKPDVVAVGADVLSVDSLNCSGTAQDPCEEGWDQSWTGTYYRLMPGTSMSTPITAGATAVFFEFYQAAFNAWPSPALAKAAMINGAVDTGIGFPSYSQGWGRINLRRSIEGPPGGRINFVEQSSSRLLATGASWSKTFFTFSNAAPLKITLTWTDPPGASGSSAPLRNNLDLVVTAPDGTVYRGNRFTGAWSTANPGSTTDTANNVENVFVQAPAAGEWTIQVSGTNVTVNPPNLTGQDFALVYSGDCADCTPLAPPDSLNATAVGNNSVYLSWSNVTSATEYHVYRALSSGGPYSLVDTVAAPTLEYTDTTAAGDVPNYYVVRSYGSVGHACESADSEEKSATPTGACGLPPAFGGIVSATPSPSSSCTVDLAWVAASPSCGGPVTYVVYRSTTGAFTPEAGNRIAIGVAGTSYVDSSGFSPGATYYYIVRAVDESNGVEDTNVVTASAKPTGTVATPSVILSEDFTGDSGTMGGFGVVSFGGTGTSSWKGVENGCPAGTGERLRFGGLNPSSSCTSNYYDYNFHAIAPNSGLGVTIPDDATNIRLSFDHQGQFESGADGILLALDANGDGTYTLVGASSISSDPYNGQIRISTTNYNAWTGTFGPYSTVASLDSTCDADTGSTTGCKGLAVKIAWIAYTNRRNNYDGWWLDNVVVQGDVYACSGTPADVQFFTARATSGTVKLEWQNPSGGGYDQAVVRYNTTTAGFPSGPTGGDGGVACASQATGPGAYNACTHSGLTNGTQIRYAVFVQSGAATSPGREVAATPFDTSGRVKWAYSTGASSMAPAGVRPGALQSGAVYSVSNDRNLHSMNVTLAGGDWPQTWTDHSSDHWVPMAMNAPAQHRPPVVPLGSDLRAFLASQDGYVYCVDARTGSQVWASSEQLGGMLQASPVGLFSAIVSGAPDRVYAGTRDAGTANQVFALDPTAGAVITRFNNGAAPVGQAPDGTGDIGIITGLTADYATERVLFTSRTKGGGSSNTVWCLDGTSTPLRRLWSTAVGDIDGSPVLYDDRVFVGTVAGEIVCLDAATGSEKWRFSTTGALGIPDGPVKAFVWPSFGTTTLYFSTGTTVWAIRYDKNAIPETVAEVWRVTSIANPSNPLLLFGTNFLMVGSGDGRLYQLDVTGAPPGTGTSVQLASGVALGSPTYDSFNHMIHVGSTAGVLYAVEVPLP